MVVVELKRGVTISTSTLQEIRSKIGPSCALVVVAYPESFTYCNGQVAEDAKFSTFCFINDEIRPMLLNNTMLRVPTGVEILSDGRKTKENVKNANDSIFEESGSVDSITQLVTTESVGRELECRLRNMELQVSRMFIVSVTTSLITLLAVTSLVRK